MPKTSTVGRSRRRYYAVARAPCPRQDAGLFVGMLAILRRRRPNAPLFSECSPIPDAKRLLVSAHGYVMTRKGRPLVGILRNVAPQVSTSRIVGNPQYSKKTPKAVVAQGLSAPTKYSHRLGDDTRVSSANGKGDGFGRQSDFGCPPIARHWVASVWLGPIPAHSPTSYISSNE